ncbi:MAG: RDD family protein [Pyrinomonadaceae bacterium]
MIQEALPDLPSNGGQVKQNNSDYSPEIEPAEESAKSSTLIEFPGGRNVPEWRKQLSQRVREVQERKAREAAEELAAAQEAGLVSCALPSGQLELVPDLENPSFNPIVTKALERLERAKRSDYPSTHRAATAVAPALTREAQRIAEAEAVEKPLVEAKRKLTVVAPQPIVEPVQTIADVPALDSTPAISESISVPDESNIENNAAAQAVITEIETAVDIPTTATSERKSIRVISDNDIALSYLETCLSLPALAADTRNDIPGLTRRFFAGVVDLLLIALMVSPAAAAIYYSGANWADPRVIGLMSGITAVTMFAYLTICTAMTGRTLAMRMFKMRTIDLRTGLIPSGGQSITRALTFVFSFALLGLGLAYALIDPDKRAVHDRLSKTIVIRT